MNRRKLALALVAAGTMAAAAVAHAANLSLWAAPYYSEGDYGTGATTQIRAITFGGSIIDTTWNFQDKSTNKLFLSAWVPYVSAQSTGVILSGDQVIGRRGTVGPTTTTTGWGDWWLQIADSYSNATGTITPYAGVKLLTGSAALSTGRNDYNFGSNFGLNLLTLGTPTQGGTPTPTLAPTSLNAGVGYTVVGVPPGLRLQDYAYYHVGLSGFVLGGVYSGYLEGQGAEQPGFPAAEDARFEWNHNINVGHELGLYNFDAFITMGLSTGSPAWSAGASLTVNM